ncbi:outer membrane beta-barrel protein [Shewanella waksmanii]|uniref:outer membrane beta-barrel protein n=1 Tax=Shewanella waksmanii TaxID=213783 RepID=UPI003734CEC2
MKKQTIVIATLLSSAMAMPAMAADWFIGGGVGAQQNTYKGSVTDNVDPGFSPTLNGKETENNVFYELRGGAYLNDNNRIYATYNYNSDDFTRQQSLLFSYDYLVGLTADNKLNWFIGATAGFNHISPDTDELSSKDRFVWGGQTGLMYKINDNVSTEIGYRYLKQDYDVSNTYGEDPVPSPMNSGITESASLNDSQQLYLSIDYRF